MTEKEQYGHDSKQSDKRETNITYPINCETWSIASSGVIRSNTSKLEAARNTLKKINNQLKEYQNEIEAARETIKELIEKLEK